MTDGRERCRWPRPDGTRSATLRPAPDRRRRVTGLVGVVAAIAIGVVGPGAGRAAAATTIGVAGAYDGSYVPGRPVAVRVQVTADRLLQARLEVTVNAGTPVAIPVEIPGGGAKEFLVVVPASRSFRFDGAVPVEARLRDGSTELAAGDGVLNSSVGQELVGLLPAALAGRGLPGAVPLAVDAGTARFAALGPAELAQAPSSLGPVSTIAAASDELVRLPVAARDAILAWVEEGGHLLVDADPGQTVDGLPPEWQPGQDGRAPTGRGEVRLVGGAIAEGRWAGLVEPTGWGVAGDTSARFGNGFVGRTLAAEAGLRVPELGWLVAFLVAYVVVAGPVLFFVVRRRGRPELAWVAVPLVAILFTGGSYVAGRGLRDTTRQVDTSILTTGATGTTADTWLGVFSAGGQTSRVRFGPGWMPGGGSDMDSTQSLSSLTLTGEGAEASLPLDAGQFGIVASRGPTADDGALEVTAVAAAGNQASGRVRNSTPYALDDVAVFVGSGGVLVGRLDAGEDKEWRVADTDTNFMFEGGPPAEFRVWGGFNGFAPDQSGVVDFTLWETAQQLGGQDFRGPGQAVAAGWTRSFAPPMEVDGRPAGSGGRSLVVGRSRLLAPADSGALDIRREVVRAPDFQTGKLQSFVVRFVTRDADGGGRTPDPSRLTLEAPVDRLEAWHDGGWRVVNATGPARGQDRNFGGPGFTEFLLPAAAVQGDVIHVRFQAFSSGVDTNGLFTIREAS